MSQLALDFARARRRDPATSKAAAARVRSFDGSHFQAILAVLRAYGPGTIYEISGHMHILPPHLDHVQVARRCGELERGGKIKRKGEMRSANGEVLIHGETRPGPSGAMCAVWCLA